MDEWRSFPLQSRVTDYGSPAYFKCYLCMCVCVWCVCLFWFRLSEFIYLSVESGLIKYVCACV